MNKRTICVLAAATVVAAGALAQTSTRPGTSAMAPLLIGVIGPLTGPSADFGVPMLNGVKLALEEINSFGGYLGRPLELVVKDDKADPQIGLQRSEELAKEGVIAAIGFCNTGVALKSIDVFQANQIPLIVPCSTGTPVTAKFPPAQSFIFRNSPSDAIQAPFMVDEILRRNWRRVAIFADSSAYGEAGLDDVRRALTRRNLEPVHVARFELGVKNLEDELRAARRAGADVIFSYTVGPENAVIARGRQAIDWNVTQVGGWPLSFPFFIDGGRGAAEGALMAQSFIAEPSNERRATFLAGYARKFGTARIPVPMAASQAYDATYLLAHAVLSLKGDQLTGPNIKAALEQPRRPYYGVVTTYARPFSEDDKDALTQNMLTVGVIRNGAVTFAHPEDAKRNIFVQRKQ